MTINLNDEIWIGIDNKAPGSDRAFYRMFITCSMESFIEAVRYIVDNYLDISNFVVIHKESEIVIDFCGFMKALNIKRCIV